MTRTIGLTSENQVEIITAYAVSNQQIQSVEEEPGWFVVGAFFLPATAPAKLDVIGCVSDDALTLHVRLFDLTLIEPVDDITVEIAETVDTRAISSQVTLTGNRAYQIQAQVIGAVEGFGYLKTATLT